MANEWCPMGVPLLAMNAPPLATNAASCRLIRSSLLMLLNPQSRDRESQRRLPANKSCRSIKRAPAAGMLAARSPRISAYPPERLLATNYAIYCVGEKVSQTQPEQESNFTADYLMDGGPMPLLNVRCCSNTDHLLRQNKTSQHAKTAVSNRSKQPPIRSPRRRGRAALAANRHRAPWPS